MAWYRRPEIRIIIVALITVMVITDFFISLKSYNDFIKQLLVWSVIISGFTLVLGAVNIGVVHGKHIMRRTSGQWYFSLWLIICVVATFLMAVGSEIIPAMKTAYDYLISNIHTPLTSAAYGLIGFYFASCIFRAFRGRNSYVAVFLISGCIVLLLNAPVTELVPWIPALGSWIVNVPNVAGTRGIVIGTAVGIIAAGLRNILGLERGGLLAEE